MTTTESSAPARALDGAYRVAFLDWLACAARGTSEPAARSAAAVADGLEGRVVAAGTAGHVLDFDDTHVASLAHLSAAVGPATLVLGAEIGATVGAVLEAYVAGFEAMGRLAAANHPRLREHGWHPTATCGAPGAAYAAATLLGLDEERRRESARLALLAAGGLRSAFGSDGKSLQVGFAAATGVRAARLAAEGATTAPGVERGWEETYGARWVEPRPDGDAIAQNWIKAYPCCLQTHGAIEAGLAAREAGVTPADSIAVVVHPVSLLAADIPDPADGLQAKFSIPYLTAYALLRGEPDLSAFEEIDAEVRAAARGVSVDSDPRLAEPEARVAVDGEVVARVEAASGAPTNPMSTERLAAKVRSLAGERLEGVLEDRGRAASEVAAAAGLL